MQESLKSKGPQNKSLKFQELLSNQLIHATKNEIQEIRYEDIKKDYEQISEMFKIEFTCEDQQKGLNKNIPKSRQIKSSNKSQLLQSNSSQGQSKVSKKSLKIVDTKNDEKNLFLLLKDFQKNSSFPRKVPVNTIVLARCFNKIIWPAIIVNVQTVRIVKYTRRIYKVNFIDQQQKSYSLARRHIIEFTPQNVEKVKKFIKNKKFFKALKIGEKLHSQLSDHKKKSLKSQQNLTYTQKYTQKIPIKLQNDQKSRLFNLVIETPRLKQSQLIFHNDSQNDSDQQVKNNFQKESPQKQIYLDKTYYSQLEHIFQQNSFKKSLKDRIDFMKNKPVIQGNQLQKQTTQKKKKCKEQNLFESIYRYISEYRNQLQYIKPRFQKKQNGSINSVILFLSLPLTGFQIRNLTKYSTIIDALLFLCTQNYVNLKNQDKQFIKKSKQMLCRLYHTLNDYRGQNEFIKGLKILQLDKLKIFQENQKKKEKQINEINDLQ